MLTMRNGVSLYPVSLPWMPRRDQISQMRMGIYPGNGPLNVNMESEHPLNQDNSSNALFNLLDNSPMHASAADFSTMMGSKTSFGLASIPTQLGPFQFSRSSKVIYCHVFCLNRILSFIIAKKIIIFKLFEGNVQGRGFASSSS